ncbi:MAG: (d)CMP kinase [Anaerolineae bacterium]|nr:MAG: (d)CMP kinase [Anaerolineae bacterium]
MYRRRGSGLSFSLPFIIAIDGPAASGKSTVGSLLAERLGYVYFDTGVMYRAVTWIALQRGIPIEDEARVSALAEAIHIEVLRPTVDDGRQYTVLVNGQDVTWNLRRPEVDRGVSPVSAYAGVRRALTAQQRRLGLQGDIVMVGRDIGTVVVPEADFKIYLDATVDERARRRWKELQLRDSSTGLDEVLAAMERRDELDSSRALAPLRPAEDAHLLDTTGLSVEQVLDRIEAWVYEAAEEE